MVPQVSFLRWRILQTMTIYLRCDAKPDNLDDPGAHRRYHEKTDFLIKNFDPGILWDDFGIRADVVVSI